MRKTMTAFFIFAFLLSGIPTAVLASDCTQDTVADRFWDWFGNLNKKKSVKNRNIARRKANRVADCAEKQARESAKTV